MGILIDGTDLQNHKNNIRHNFEVEKYVHALKTKPK